MRVCILLHCLLPLVLPAQDQAAALIFSTRYGGQLPGGDFQHRFGSSLRTSLFASYQGIRQKGVWGARSFFQFGGSVKENVLSQILTPDGYLIGNDKSPAAVALRQRAWFLGIGRGFRFPPSNLTWKRLQFDFSAGIFGHKIRIQEDAARFVPQIHGDYKKGYDRLANGPACLMSMAFQLEAGQDRFLAGFDFLLARTYHRRASQFDTGTRDTDPFHVFQPGLFLAYQFRKDLRDPGSLRY